MQKERSWVLNGTDLKQEELKRMTRSENEINEQKAGDRQVATSARGWLVATYRYYKGRKLGPYYARHWKVGKKIHREYVKPDDVEKVLAACQAHRDERKRRKEGARQINIFLDNHLFMYKMIALWEKGKHSTAEQYAYLDRLNKEGMYITGRPPYRPRRLFGVPLHSKRFLRCLGLTRDVRMSQTMWHLKLDPEDLDIRLEPTGDEQVKEWQYQAIKRAYLKKVLYSAWHNDAKPPRPTRLSDILRVGPYSSQPRAWDTAEGARRL